MKTIITIFSVLFFLLLSCKKDNPEEQLPGDDFDTYGYEVDCESCTILFVDDKKSTQSVFNKSGKIVIDFNLTVYHELEVTVTLNSNNVKLAKAAIIKNGQPIKTYQSYSSFKLTSTGGSSTGNPGSNPSSPSTPSNPTSTVCGAKNKTGGYCKRKVAGGGRCWQHR